MSSRSSRSSETKSKSLLRDTRGATAVEYGIMVALIAVVIIAAVSLLGGSLTDVFTQIQCRIAGGTEAACAIPAAG